MAQKFTKIELQSPRMQRIKAQKAAKQWELRFYSLLTFIVALAFAELCLRANGL